MGTPAFAVPALQELVESGHAVVAVYTQPDRPAGRGRKLTPSPVKAWAQERGLEILQPASLRSPEAAEQLRSLRPDALAVAAYGLLLPTRILEVPVKGALNIHPSLLPKYRGPSPIAAAILAGEETTGVTIMVLDAGMDSGPLLAQQLEPIAEEDTAENLGERLAWRGARLMAQTLSPWLGGKLEPTPQNDAEATYCKRIAKEDGEIDWGHGAAELARKLRAFWPWPGCHTTWRGRGLRIVEGSAVQGPAHEPGTVVLLQAAIAPGDERQAIGVATGEGILLLRQVQPAGRRQMKAREFLAGHGDFLGARLPS